MFVSPMLLHEVSEPFNDDNYLAELKMDGIRLIYSNELTTQLYTRHNLNVTQRFPELLKHRLPKGIILDGELIQADMQGRPDFEDLMSRFQTTNKYRIKRLSETRPVTFCVFDVLYQNNTRITTLPLLERKQILNKLLPENLDTIVKTTSVQGNGIALFDAVRKQKLEGIVLKRSNSVYEIKKRSYSWLKVVNYQYANVWITGYYKDKLGWLLSFEDGTPAGIMELGITPSARRKMSEFKSKLKNGESKDFVFFAPGILRCQVKYRNLTKVGYLHLPTFMNWLP